MTPKTNGEFNLSSSSRLIVLINHDYSNGFTHNIENADNGPQLPLGDSNEKLLSLAIDHIKNNGRVTITTEGNIGVSLGYSYDFKIRNSDLVINSNGLPQ